MPSATLQPALIEGILGGFPDNEGWCLIPANRLLGKRGTCDWTPLRHLNGQGGVYAFLFPADLFANSHTITLDGPNGRLIPFSFAAKDVPPTSGRLVSYVGRAANLLQRFRWHFGLAKRNTGAQVQYGLVKCGKCQDRYAAVRFMLDNAPVAYCVLDGDGNVANRDIIEVALSARFRAPFNIKSEH
jgi:hypothetical protein